MLAVFQNSKQGTRSTRQVCTSYPVLAKNKNQFFSHFLFFHFAKKFQFCLRKIKKICWDWYAAVEKKLSSKHWLCHDKTKIASIGCVGTQSLVGAYPLTPFLKKFNFFSHEK